MRELVGLAFLVTTGQAMPVWAASAVAFIVTLGLLALRFRSGSRDSNSP